MYQVIAEYMQDVPFSFLVLLRPLEATGISRIFQGVGNDLKRHDYSVEFHELALATTSTPSHKPAQLVQSCYKKRWKITQESQGTLFKYIYFILCFNMFQLSAIPVTNRASRCSIFTAEAPKESGDHEGVEESWEDHLASEGSEPKNLGIWPEGHVDFFVPWLKMYHFSYF